MVSAELGRGGMIRTECAICESDAWDDELHTDRLGADAATYGQFSARRQPDRVHYRMVRCGKCGLIRSDPVLPEEELARLYCGSAFDYEEESGFARLTYARYLRESLPQIAKWRLAEDIYREGTNGLELAVPASRQTPAQAS